jgi:hypothetical protein
MSSRQVRDKTGDEVPDWIADEKRRAERIRKAQAELEPEAKARRRRHRLPCLVTGGGVSDDGKHWHPARNGFLVPIRALGNLVRGKLKGAPSGLGRAESRTGKLWSRSLCEQLICRPHTTSSTTLMCTGSISTYRPQIGSNSEDIIRKTFGLKPNFTGAMKS